MVKDVKDQRLKKLCQHRPESFLCVGFGFSAWRSDSPTVADKAVRQGQGSRQGLGEGEADHAKPRRDSPTRQGSG